jgi:hypothetical protein
MAAAAQVPDIWVTLLEKALWPLCVLTLIVFFVLLFREQIRDLLKSLATRHFRWGRAEIGAPTRGSEQPVAKSEQLSVEPARELTEANVFEESDNLYLKSRTEELTRQISGKKFASEPQKSRWLMREGAAVLVQLEFERVYHTIWESQLELVSSANNLPLGVELSGVKTYWAGVAAAATPEVKDTFERWYGYPVSMGLVALDGEKFKITPRGRLFLQYLIGQGYDLHGIRRGR